MKVLHYYPQALHHDSGVTAALRAWTSAQARRGHEVLIASAPGAMDPGYYDVLLSIEPHLGRSRSSFIPKPPSLLALLARHDLVVLHEGWTLANAVAGLLASRASTPYFVMPHGVYEPGVMQGLKGPRALRTAVERYVLDRAAGVHLFFDSERPLIQAIAPSATSFVAPTGWTPQDEGERWTGEGGYVLWYGRYDVQHKGLDLLLGALATMAPADRPVVRLHGVDYVGGKQQVENMVDALGLSETVSVNGAIRGIEKARALSETVAYVHPARWECYGVALLEALSAGVPVVVSRSVHIAGLLRETQAADIAEPSAEGWAAALAQVCERAETRTHSDRASLWPHLAWSRVLALTDAAYERAGIAT